MPTDPLNNVPLVLHSIRGESADVFNRLRSIHEDSRFVLEVTAGYPQFPLLANQRCGAWYTDPSKARSEFVYFKSTDGHFGQWDFNLRRANLHLLPILQSSGGIVIVDSTRSGKSMPDALSKTIPLWCAVINKAMMLRYSASGPFWELHGELHSPPACVSPSERDQMASLVPGLAESLLASSFHLLPFDKPLRPFWVTTRSAPHSLPTDCLPVICVSASKQVTDGIERRTHAYTYIQGAADDHESWSKGLTPVMFWKHQKELLACNKDSTPELVDQIVQSFRTNNAETQIQAINMVHGRISFSTSRPIEHLETNAAVIQVQKPVQDGATSTLLVEPGRLMIYANGKRDQIRFLHEILPAVDKFGKSWLSRTSHKLIIVDIDGSYDISIGIMMLLLARNFDDEGREIEDPIQIIKTTLRRRLEWIQQSIPRANPSRTTMKRLNEYAISQLLLLHRQPHSMQPKVEHVVN